MGKKMLLIVDPQNDFVNGSLAVEGAEGAMISLARYIERNAMNYNLVGVTIDWHPINHCSFKDNGGIWPLHCVQHTNGAAIFPAIFDAIKTHVKCQYVTFEKGQITSREEYSVMDNEISKDHLLMLLDEMGITEIDVCGIAYEYCVTESILGLVKHLKDKDIKINLLTDYTPAIGDKSKATEDLITNHINLK